LGVQISDFCKACKSALFSGKSYNFVEIEKDMKFYSISKKEELRKKACDTIGLKEVYIDKDLPFKPEFKYYYYIEPYRHPQINRYFHTYIDSLNNSIEDNYQVIYLPSFIEKELLSVVEYNRPGIDNSIIESLKSNASQVQKLYNDIQYHLENASDGFKLESPCLLHVEDSRGLSVYRFSLFPLKYEDDHQFHQLLRDILEVPFFDSGIRQSTREERLENVLESAVRETPDYDWADKCSITNLAYEIQERIKKLQLMGVSDFVIRNLIQLPEAKLSPLLITPDYRIVMPAYNNMEIEMPTLSRVVFFFYLRHPEGLRFKELVDYREELLQIYCTISNRENLDKMKQSIDELVDSTRNSINEKCSRIRSAFITRFTDDLAHHYYITGSSSTPKRITLDRNMLIDKSGITEI